MADGTKHVGAWVREGGSILNIGLISLLRVRVRTAELAQLGVMLPGFKIFTPQFEQKPVAAVEREFQRVTELVDRPFIEFAADNTFENPV